MKQMSLRFVRWGAGLLVLGLVTGYGPLHHYLGGGVTASCPWAPTHGHVVLLGWVAFTLFGLVYRVLPDWGAPSAVALKLTAIHLWVSVVSVLGVYTNGIFGYRLLDHLSPDFYYKPDPEKLRLWLAIDGWFLTLFGLGCVLFMLVLFGTTRQGGRQATP